MTQKRNLSNEERRNALHHLLMRIKPDGSLPYGSFAEVATMFSCKWKTISRIWQRSEYNPSSERMCKAVDSKKKGASGRKPIHTFDDLRAKIAAIPAIDRTSLREISTRLGMPISTLHDYYKRGLLKKTLKFRQTNSHWGQ